MTEFGFLQPKLSTLVPLNFSYDKSTTELNNYNNILQSKNNNSEDQILNRSFAFSNNKNLCLKFDQNQQCYYQQQQRFKFFSSFYKVIFFQVLLSLILLIKKKES